MSGEHAPKAFPICPCGLQASKHRPTHKPKMWPICSCGAPAINHRVKHAVRGSGAVCECGLPRAQHLSTSPYTYQYVGIDGEGLGRKPHRYVLLSAATNVREWSLENMKGIRTREALDWIVDSLDGCRVFSYGFGYDITCIIRDMPNALIYELLRPSTRYYQNRLKPVKWEGYKIDWLQGKFVVRKGAKRVVIWDILKFFQCPFVKALDDWGIPTENIEEMKRKRGRFRVADMPRIRTYNLTECKQLSALAQKLVLTHRDCGLTLHSYYGPGSTASVMISHMGAMQYKADPPRAMVGPIACAFSGGRFEHSAMGLIKPIYGADISSAYPYQLCFLPCLKCGEWKRVRGNVRRALEGCTTALVRYRYHGRKTDVWAPFPHRDKRGSICYPYRNQGWAWLPEIEAAMRAGWGKLELLDAWVYKTECAHKPFAEIAEHYRRRCELGKDAAGRVLKLGCNSVEGKLIQSKGPNPKFQSWVWGGLVTSGTRAQILDVISSADNPADIVGIATDGVYSRVPLNLPLPRDTGTSDLAKPLGGWETKEYPEGMLFLKPGIYIAIGDGEVRARGIGRRALVQARDDLIDTWERGEHQHIVTVDRFHGAKTTINLKLRRTKRYGQWTKMRIRVAFTCPNRTSDMGLLACDEPSTPYSRSLLSPEKLEAIIMDTIDYEQPA